MPLYPGTIVHTEKGLVEVSVSQERWDKEKGMIVWIKVSLKEDDIIDFKILESYRGFLI
jgi:hypothetical protein